MTDEELVAVLRWRGSALQEGAFFAAADRIEQYEEAYQYALHLAKALRENYPLNPDFRFLGDLVGLLTQIDNMVAGLSLTTERDAAYARGYSDAETEISKSALGQRNAFLHSQYADAKLRIEALTVDRAEARAGWHKYEGAWMAAEGKLADVEAERDRLREALEQFLIEYDVVDLAHAEPSSLTEAVLAARAALKGEKA